MAVLLEETDWRRRGAVTVRLTPRERPDALFRDADGGSPSLSSASFARHARRDHGAVAIVR